MKKYLLVFVGMFFIGTLMAQSQDLIQITCYQGQKVREVRPILDEWCIQLFREFPYLYVYQEETDYNTIFETDPEAFVLFAEKNGKKIGVIQANPLNSSFLEQELYTPFARLEEIRQKGFDPDRILYISCFLMLQEDRMNHKAMTLLFDSAIELAKKMGKTQICYMEITHNPDHPLKPYPYIPLEPWRDLGVNFQSMDVQMQISWPTLQSDKTVRQEDHIMALYYVDLLK
jgi:hypothetical protein